MSPSNSDREKIRSAVSRAVNETPVFDIHTHLYDPAFSSLCLAGLDDLLVYHYLVAEAFRYLDLPYDDFWALSKKEQADLIWKELFLDHTPISEACRGVLTTLQRLGLDVRRRDLEVLRKWFAQQVPAVYLTRCLELANVRALCMTNSPFDEAERAVWATSFARDERFIAALRIDPLLLDWETAGARLAADGYEVASDLAGKTMGEVRRFLADWADRIEPRYVMVSLPPTFAYPEQSVRVRMLEEAVLPFCGERNLPFAMMIGSKRATNPALRLAGDSVGRGSIEALEALIAKHPQNKFLVTMLSRENQHELCVVARKFRNLHVFGCWWFTNVPSLIEEITRLRLELIGLSMTPQHSDARVLDQVIYKWDHSRAVIVDVLTEKYQAVAATGWEISPAEMKRDAQQLLGGDFERFVRA